MIRLILLVGALVLTSGQVQECSVEFMQACSACIDVDQAGLGTNYSCTLPGLEGFTPGQYEGTSGKTKEKAEVK
jgi:hypothetical protein